MRAMCLRMLPLFLASLFLLSRTSLAAAAESPVIVEAVECKGAVAISCDFIRRKLHIQINSAVSDDAVQSAQLRLSALPNFVSVRVYLEKGSEKGKALLIVAVVEASPFVTEFALGLQHSSAEQSHAPDAGPRQPDRLAENLTGRIGHLNLFGRQKIGELAVKAYHVGYDQVDFSNLSSELHYIDPNLFGTDRMFMSATGGYYFSKADAEGSFESYDPVTDTVAQREYRFDDEIRGWHADLSVGLRLWQYSYVFAGFEHYADSYHGSREFQSPYEKYADEGSNRTSSWQLGYGWDSEDDAYFPTRGSRLSAIARYNSSINEAACGCHQLDWRIAYKHSWLWGRSSVWSLNVGGEPEAAIDRLRSTNNTIYGGVGITYAHFLPISDTFGGLRRGRWYVQVAGGNVDLSRDGHIGGHPSSASVELGLRFESKVLGIVNLSATGSRFFARSGQ